MGADCGRSKRPTISVFPREAHRLTGQLEVRAVGTIRVIPRSLQPPAAAGTGYADCGFAGICGKLRGMAHGTIGFSIRFHHRIRRYVWVEGSGTKLSAPGRMGQAIMRRWEQIRRVQVSTGAHACRVCKISDAGICDSRLELASSKAGEIFSGRVFARVSCACVVLLRR